MSQYRHTLRCTKTDILGKKELRYLKHRVAEHRRTELELARRSMTNFRSDFAFYFNRYVVSKYIDDITE